MNWAHRCWPSNLGAWETFWICFYSLATYGNAGALREQVCMYMCPYARFQSAMFDRDTLIVSYDPARGEPRGSRQRGASTASRGSATASTARCACRPVRPASISARACNTSASPARPASMPAMPVMDKVGYPRGLIRYTTQNAVEGKPQHIFRPRVILYGSVLLLLFAGFVVTLANRAAVRLDVIRDRNTLYRELPDGQIENVYQLKILNKDDQPRRVRISVTGLPGARIETAPAEIDARSGRPAGCGGTHQRGAQRGTARPGRSEHSAWKTPSDGAVQAERDARFFGPLQ